MSRLVGMETEYAIRFSTEGDRPDHDVIYEAMVGAIGRFVRYQRGKDWGKSQIFIQNGGAFCYEHLPYCPGGGLIEGATPECRGPTQVLLYQRAQEALLRKALPEAEADLGRRGFEGELGLLKNCRDAEGHVYGAQENFEADIARGAGLVLYRLGLAFLLPILFGLTLITWVAEALFLALIVVLALVGALAYLCLPPFRRSKWGQGLFEEDRRLETAIGRATVWMGYLLTWPLVVPFSVLLRLLAFRAIRREGLAFLLSRHVLSGCGTVSEDGRFGLSEKGPAIRRPMRFFISPNDRTVFDTGNLMKQLVAPMALQIAPLLALFRRRQRLQLGLADSNMIQEAEYLKMGTTALVLDMIEGGFLRDAPRLRAPVRALHRLVADRSLTARVDVQDGRRLTSLELQRYYLERARDFLRESRIPSMESLELVRLWDDVLTTLERGDMGRLVGRIDWTTKRYLLEKCGGSAAVRKTIDLRYHELGDGYLARLEQAGATSVLLGDEEIERAITVPPADTPAALRGRLLSERLGPTLASRVSWHSARIGGRLRGKIIRFRPRKDREGREGD